MARIDCPEFSKIKKLLTEGTDEEVKLAILILKKDFSREDFLQSFPNSKDSIGFKRKYNRANYYENTITYYKDLTVGFHTHYIWAKVTTPDEFRHVYEIF